MGGWAFYPFAIIIGIVILRIIYNVAIGVPQQGNSYSVLAITLIASAACLFFGKGTIGDRLEAFVSGPADSTTMLMVTIMMFSGAFTTVSSAMGGIESLSNFLLRFIPSNMIYVGILFVTSVIALAIGGSVSAATTMAPVAASLALQAGLNLPIAIAAVMGGAILGDNLSFISDTTIAASRGLGVDMRDKFKFNVSLVIPAFILSVIIFGVLGMSGGGGTVEIGSYNIVKMLPYFYIIIAAIAGMNMIVVLSSGILVSVLIGMFFSDFTLITFMGSINDGVVKMTTTIFTTILVKGIMGVVAYNGGVVWLIGKLTANIKSAKGAQYSVAALTFCLGALVRSTSAIVIAAPLAKEICEPYKIDRRRTASLLDIFSTAQNGFVFWAGLSVDCAAIVDGLDATDLLFVPIYPVCIILMAVISIQFGRSDKYKDVEVVEPVAN